MFDVIELPIKIRIQRFLLNLSLVFGLLSHVWFQPELDEWIWVAIGVLGARCCNVGCPWWGLPAVCCTRGTPGSCCVPVSPMSPPHKGPSPGGPGGPTLHRDPITSSRQVLKFFLWLCFSFLSRNLVSQKNSLWPHLSSSQRSWGSSSACVRVFLPCDALTDKDLLPDQFPGFQGLLLIVLFKVDVNVANNKCNSSLARGFWSFL